MARHMTDGLLDEVVDSIAVRLKPSGFVRRGLVLRTQREGNCGLLEFQRSTKSSRARIVFTVNLGIVCGALLDSSSPALERARIIDAHVRQRIGMLLPGRPDKWWEITQSTDSGLLSKELSELIVRVAVPYIMGLLNTTAIISLWQSGQAPGLTGGQRVRLLSRLLETDRKREA